MAYAMENGYKIATVILHWRRNWLKGDFTKSIVENLSV